MSALEFFAGLNVFILGMVVGFCICDAFHSANKEALPAGYQPISAGDGRPMPPPKKP